MKKFKTMVKTASKPSSPQSIEEKIRNKAYELFEKRGYSHGNDLADWLEAEKIVKSNKR
ncbi:MAG: DUF2934 domain-containing protein [Candidatus Omnitrophica bacterium]|nr:DUF2934 domain-containing protein [Candidatus Omnitrophota bacterium]